MPEVTNPSQSVAEAALFGELQQLYERAGRPSTRSVAQGVGGISHTTVHAALRGTTVPTWPVLQKIVEYLKGDIRRFRQLWEEAGARSAARPRPAARTRAYSQPSNEISVFVSYAHIDDAATYSRISQVIKGFANIYQSLTGQTVGVFKDVESIKLGDDWRDRIRLGLSASSIFLAFISPAYLRSMACREELSEFLAFLDTSSSTRLIVPLLFASPDRILKDFANDELWMRLAKLQWLDISSLRFAEPGSREWITAVSKIADRTDEVLRSFAADGISIEPEPTPAEQKSGQAKLERMAEIERMLPDSAIRMQRFGQLMETLGEEVGTAAPEMLKADTFAGKLQVSERLATQLDPIAAEMGDVSEQLANDFDGITFLVNFALDALRQDPDNVDSDVISLLRSTVEAATVGIQSFSSIEDFTKSMDGAIGFSSRLDDPLKKIRKACLHIADLRGILSGWQEEVNAADDRYPQAGLLSDASQMRKPEVDERRAQAKRVFIWEERLDRDPRLSQAQAAVAGSVGEPVIVAHLRNSSEWPIYDIRLTWHRGTAAWGEPDHFASLMPGDETSATRSLPLDLPDYVNPGVFGAVAFFHDSNGVTWRVRPDGVLDEIPPD